MKPTQNRLLVKVEEKKPEKGKELAQATSVMTGVVVKAGDYCQFIKKGHKVVFAPYGIDEVIVGKDKLLVVEETSVLLYE